MLFLPFQRPSEITPDFHNRIIVATGHRPQKCGGFSEGAQLLLKQIAIDCGHSTHVALMPTTFATPPT